MAKSEVSKKFSQSLRDRIGMAPPPQEELAAKVQDAWTGLEQAVISLKESADAVSEASQNGPLIQEAVADGLLGVAGGLEDIVSGLEGLEGLLIDAGLVSDDQLLEPVQAASPAAAG